MTIVLIGAGLVRATASIVQGYHASSSLEPGTIVSLDQSGSTNVSPATTATTSGLLGVVVGSGDSLIQVSSDNAQAEVATNGIVSSFVSDLNGDVRVGDSITASPISGVGMRATTTSKVVGMAQGDFNHGTKGSAEQKIKDKTGAEKTVSVGLIPVNVGVKDYISTATDKTILPAFLINIATAVAGHRVSTLQIIVSLIIIILALIFTTTLVYGATRSSIISIGRNPLSQGAIYRSLLQVSALVIGILGVAIGAVYLILSRG